MKLSILFFLFFLILFGCGPGKFTIKQSGDKFSDPSTPLMYYSVNNRLSTKSTVGGIHVDATGLFLNPNVILNKKTQDVEKVGIYLVHLASLERLGFNPPLKAILLTNNSRIELDFSGQDFVHKYHNWNPYLGDYEQTYNEFASAEISIIDLKKLAYAEYLEVKIVGRELSQTYDRDEIEKDFILNMRSFYLRFFKE